MKLRLSSLALLHLRPFSTIADRSMVIAGNAGKKSVSLKRKPAAKTAAPRTQAKSEAKSAGGGDTTTTTATADKDGGLKQLRMDDYVVSYTHSMDDGDDHSASAPARAAAAAAQKPLGGFQSARSMVKPDGEGTEAARACKSTSGSDEDEDEQAASDDALSGTVAAIRLDETQEQISKMDINRPLLIVAGAGSGKTTTLCARVIEMLRQGVAAQQILVITFTNKAADELKHRIRQYTRAAGIPQATAAEGMPYASTFHSWCYTL
ncbi:ATP-dependent DNA helicase Rep, partial [Coemansia sp. RSA 2703]